jgi:hypothetical protein
MRERIPGSFILAKVCGEASMARGVKSVPLLVELSGHDKLHAAYREDKGKETAVDSLRWGETLCG